jgi:dihydrofolate reductase
MNTIQIVVAYSRNRCIGRNNTLPWRLPADLAHFKKVTLGNPIIMGRNTWESLGRPLPGRPNLVISRTPGFQPEGATVWTSLEDALLACNDAGRICIIGGEQLFRAALPYASEIVATEIHADIEGDTFFPELNAGEWQETERLAQPAENGLDYDFVTYTKRRMKDHSAGSVE